MNRTIKPVHPFPARMASSIVFDRLPDSKPSLKILDPMAGSGTTLAVARSKGHSAYGVDRDPLAVIIAKTWCTDICSDMLRAKAHDVLKRARETLKELTSKSAYPEGVDRETMVFVDYWFDRKNRKQLTALSKHISLVRDTKVRNALWTAFSRIIITKRIGVSLAIDISHSRPHRVYNVAPVFAFDVFLASVEKVIKANSFVNPDVKHLKTYITCGDSRALGFVNNFFDMVITSPPYLNAIDYLRGHKLSLVWMKKSIGTIRELRSTNIGAEVKEGMPDRGHIKEALEAAAKYNLLPPRYKGFLIRYIVDMDKVCFEINRVLKPGGTVVYVVGDCTTKGVFVRNSETIKKLSEHHGLELILQEERSLPENRRYLPPPSNNSAGNQLQARMRKEIIITMRKPAQRVCH